MTAKLNEEKIKRQAKAIMDEFVKALDKTGEISGDVGIERAEMAREARQSRPDKEFRERFLKNAPKKTEGYIVAEKKSW